MLWHATMMCLQEHSWGTLLRSRLSTTLLWVFLEPIPLSCTVAASGAKKNLCLLQLVWFRVAKDLEQSYWHQAAHEETTVRLDHVQANKGLDQVLTLVWGTPVHTSAFLPWRCTLDNDLITCLVLLPHIFIYLQVTGDNTMHIIATFCLIVSWWRFDSAKNFQRWVISHTVLGTKITIPSGTSFL